MITFSKKAWFAALCLCLLAVLPCRAARRPQWASSSAIETLNNNRSNNTYRFLYTDPFYTDKGLLYENRNNALVEQLAAAYGLSENAAKVDTANHLITFGADIWFKYKLVDQQEVFDSDVRQNYDWTLYQLYAVSEKNTEPQYDDFLVSEPCGGSSLAQSLVPGLGQWNKGQKDKAIVIWATEAATVAGAVYFFARDHHYKNLGFDSKALSYRQMGYISAGVAVGMYVYNLIDAYVCKGAKKVTVKKRSTETALVPFATPCGAGMSLALRF